MAKRQHIVQDGIKRHFVLHDGKAYISHGNAAKSLRIDTTTMNYWAVQYEMDPKFALARHGGVKLDIQKLPNPKRPGDTSRFFSATSVADMLEHLYTIDKDVILQPWQRREYPKRATEREIRALRKLQKSITSVQERKAAGGRVEGR